MKTNPFLIFLAFLAFLKFASCSNFNDKAHSQNTVMSADALESVLNLPLDSLLQIAATLPQDTILARIYYAIGNKYYRLNENQKAKEYFLMSNELSEKLNWLYGSYLFSGGYGAILRHEGLYDSLVVIRRQVLERVQNGKLSEKYHAVIMYNMAMSYHHIRWYETALKYCYEALLINEKLGDKYKIAEVYNLMGDVYDMMEMIDERMAYSEKALEIINEKPDTITRAYFLNSYAHSFIRRKEFDKAEKYLYESLRICTLHNNKFLSMVVYVNFSTNALIQYDLDKAETFIRKTMELSLVLKNPEWLCVANFNFACLEIYRGNFQKAEEYLKKALEIADEHNLSDRKQECYEKFFELSIARHDFRKSLFYEEKADSIENALTSEKTITYAKEMAAKYETEKKELEIARQQSVIAQANLQRGLLLAGIAVAILFVALLWYMLRLRNRRNLTLSEMNATKDKFFSIVSHDLKNPAVAQRDALRLLSQNGNTWDAATRTDYYGELLNSAESEVELVFNLLDWARLQTGRITCEPELYVPAARLRTDVALARTMAEKKGVSLFANIPDHVQVSADGNMLATVVRNLLTNAVKYTAAGGTVTFDISPCTDAVRHVSTNDGYIFSITDTGVGMSREMVQNLFRIDKSHSREGTAAEQGSGLGLIVCREFLEKHGSTLHVESEEGKGSKFWFELKTVKN